MLLKTVEHLYWVEAITRTTVSEYVLYSAIARYGEDKNAAASKLGSTCIP